MPKGHNDRLSNRPVGRARKHCHTRDNKTHLSQTRHRRCQFSSRFVGKASDRDESGSTDDAGGTD